MILRRFVCTAGSSNKFWRGGRWGTRVVCQWGRIGTSGQSLEKEFSSPDSAKLFLRKKIEEKLGKGYREIKSEDTSMKAAPKESAVMVMVDMSEFNKPKTTPIQDYGGLDLSAPVQISEEDMRSTAIVPELDLSDWSK